MAKRKSVSVDDLFGGAPASKTKRAPKPARAKRPAQTSVTEDGSTKSTRQRRKKRTKAELQVEYERYGKPTAYRLPPSLTSNVARIATREGVDQGDLVRAVLERFIEQYQAGQWQLEKTPARYKVK